MAAAKVFGLEELVRLIAEQARNSPDVLRSLCLVNRAVNAAVSPVLYRNVTIRSRPGRDWALYNWVSKVDPEDHLRHIRALKLRFHDPGVDDEEKNRTIQAFLPGMPLLESFTWHECVILNETLGVLHRSCPKLKALHLRFFERIGEAVLGFGGLGPEAWQTTNRASFGRVRLSQFTGLEHITLAKLYQSLGWWGYEIVDLLANNTDTLKTLQLSMSPYTLHQYHTIYQDDEYDCFFDRTCDAYGKRPCAPLRLQTLKLGLGMFAIERDSLPKLTDLSCLEDVHVNNGDLVALGWTICQYHQIADVLCNNFLDRSPNLRRFAAATCWEGIHHAFAQWTALHCGQGPRQMAISCNQMPHQIEVATSVLVDETIDTMPFMLPGLQFRMLDLDLDRYNQRVRPTINYPGHMNPDEIRLDLPSTPEIITALAQDSSDCLEGLTAHMGGDLESLHGFNKHQFGLLFKAVDELSALTQLKIFTVEGYYVGNEARAKSRVAARYMAEARPTLRFIWSHDWCWRVIRDGFAIKLEEMTREEIEEVELFTTSIWDPRL